MTAELTKPKRKRGRPGMTEEQLLREGSWRGKKKRKDRLAKEATATKLTHQLTLKLAAPKLPRLTKSLIDKAIRCLPGYDPFAEAGDCSFDYALARKVIKFFHEELVHVKSHWRGQPFILEQWQMGIIANLFGWMRPDGLRRYRHSFIFVPRKNGKSALVAGILLYLLFEDGEPMAEIYGMASKHEQACVIFDFARAMVNHNEKLKERCKILNGQAKSMVLKSDDSVYKVLHHTHDAATALGGSVSGAVIDELLALPDGSVVEALETGAMARPQPMFIKITTSDFDREDSYCNDEHDYADTVRREGGDPTLLVAIYEAPKDSDWTDPKVWAAANPNLGVSISHEAFRTEYNLAQKRPSKLNRFKRLHLNIRTGSETLWIPQPEWDACAGKIDIEQLKGKTCFGGLDLASYRDLTSLVLMFPEGDKYKLLPFFWMPKEIGKRVECKNRNLYEKWMRMGLFRVTEGDSTDYAVVFDDIQALGKLYGIQEIAVDMAFQGAQLSTDLSKEGFNMTAFGQGFRSYAAPTLEFESLWFSHRLTHPNNPVLNWMAGNVNIMWNKEGNCMKPTKKHERNKIDGIAGAVMAVGLSMVHVGEKTFDATGGVFHFDTV